MTNTIDNQKLQGSNHFRIWIIALSSVLVIGALLLLSTIKEFKKLNTNDFIQPYNNSEFGIFLDRGQLDSWGFKYGRAKFSIETDAGILNDYSVALSLKTKYFKDVSSESERSSGSRKLVSGSVKEIEKAMFVEIYLDSPYNNLEARAETVIYWE